MGDQNLILIGPIGSGKTTLAPLLASALGMSAIDLDDVRFGYYDEIGYDAEHVANLHEEKGVDAVVRYWKPFEIHSVERLLQDHRSGAVIAFGGGQSVYDDPALHRRAQEALAPHEVVLLLPSVEVEESMAILRERVRMSEPDLPEQVLTSIEALNRGFLTHPANADLADHVVITGRLSVQEARDAVLTVLPERA